MSAGPASFATPRQLGLIAVSLRRLAPRYALDDYRLDYLSDHAGRLLDSSAELTRREANGVLARLRRAGALRTRRGRARNTPRTGAASTCYRAERNK